MAFSTYAEGLKDASTLANRAIATEASLPQLSHLTSPLPTLQRAFAQYVSAAEAYSHLLASSLVPQAERSTVQRKWRLVLERAEKVKRRIEALGGRVGTREVDGVAEEAAVLRRGGILNGVKAEVWRSAPHDSEFLGEVFVDTQPELAKEQERADPVWKPVAAAGWEVVRVHGAGVRQGPGADCSVTAGLGSCLAHNERWGTTLGQDALYPQAVSGRPRPSENAKHVVKLLLNGAWRGVVVDALLPQSASTGAPLHITTTTHRHHNTTPTATTPTATTFAQTTPAWLPLAVKGYFKALGGYSIPGSNPAPDVYAFTGWIPERLDLTTGFQREKEWARVHAAWLKGSVIVTLGTGRDAEARGLVKHHAYGVVDVLEQDGERMLRVFDPGSAKLRDAADTLRDLSLTDSAGEGEAQADGMLMSWDEVCTRFETLNLNWDPALLPVTVERHWSWPKPADSGADNRSSPRYRITACAPSSTPGADLWLLLSQHQTSKASPLDDVALHVFRDYAGKWCQAQVQHATDPYANALHTLVRFPLREGENILNAVASRDRGTAQTGFTFRAFATAGVVLEMTRVAASLPFSETVSSELTKRSAGGHPGHATHHLNPQYRLTVSPPPPGSGKKATLRFALNGTRDLAWSVKLLWGKGERVFELSSDVIVASSGAFSYGMAYTEASIEPGTYTVLVSSWERDAVGAYTLAVESSAAVTLAAILQEGAGLFARTVSGKWDAATAGGRPSGNNYAANPALEVTISAPGVLCGRLYLPHPAPIPINITLFRRAPGGGIGEQVVTSGPYVDAVSGAALPRTRLDPGIYLAVPSTYETGTRAEWVLDLWDDKAFTASLAR